MTINDLANTEHDPYYGRYIRKLSDDSETCEKDLKTGGETSTSIF